MVVLSITITPSSTETTPGIPDTITLSTNLPATIFYTLDGTTPDINSAVYVIPIALPQYLPQVVLTVLAFNGTQQSAVISQTYIAILSEIPSTVGDRTPQATVIGLNTQKIDEFPFGSNNSATNFNYDGPNAVNTVDNQNLPSSSTAFDANGNPAAFINQPLNPFGVPQTDLDGIGQVQPGGGTKVEIDVIGKNTPDEYRPEFSSTSDKIFNPRALVIFQDLTDPKFQRSQPIVMRPQFSLERPEIVKDGALFATPIDVSTYTGTFIRSFYNSADHTQTSYYWDSKVNRWIIHRSTFVPSNPDFNSLSNIVFPKTGEGGDKVFKWLYFGNMGRTLPG